MRLFVSLLNHFNAFCIKHKKNYVTPTQSLLTWVNTYIYNLLLLEPLF